MKFTFCKFNACPSGAFPDRHSNSRPIIPIHLLSSDQTQRIQYYVLLDTGTDYNLFHADLAELLGISDFRSGKEEMMFGIEGNSIMSYFHDTVIEVGGWKYKAYSGFTDFAGKTKLDQMPYGILGQAGFFNFFKTVFDYEKSEIEIKEKSRSIFIA